MPKVLSCFQSRGWERRLQARGASQAPSEQGVLKQMCHSSISSGGSLGGSTDAWQIRDGLCKATCELALECTLRMEKETGKEHIWRKKALRRSGAWGKSLPLPGPRLPQYLVVESCAGSGASCMGSKPGSITYHVCVMVKLLNLWAQVFSCVNGITVVSTV